MGRRRIKRIKSISPPTEIDIGMLTLRQIEVLSLIALGKSNKEIAQALSVTPSTVKSHITRLLHICGKRTRTDLAVLWTEIMHKPGDRDQASEDNDYGPYAVG